MSRKIIQIAIDPSWEHSGEGAKIYALCDDGTLWSLIDEMDKFNWERMKDIPQDKDK